MEAVDRSRLREGESMVPLEEDRALLDGFRSGNREALGTVFRRYLPVVMRAIRGGARAGGGTTRLPAGVDEMEIESIAQETFVRAFSPSSRNTYDGIRPFSAYIATIAKNLLIDAARKRARTPPLVSLDDVDFQLHDVGAGEQSLNKIEDDELNACLLEFRSTLSPDDRLIFGARFEQQLSLREAARATGVALFKIRRIDVRLRQQLLETLRSEGHLQSTNVRIGASVLDRSNPKEVSS